MELGKLWALTWLKAKTKYAHLQECHKRLHLKWMSTHLEAAGLSLLAFHAKCMPKHCLYFHWWVYHLDIFKKDCPPTWNYKTRGQYAVHIIYKIQIGLETSELHIRSYATKAHKLQFTQGRGADKNLLYMPYRCSMYKLKPRDYLNLIFSLDHYQGSL